MSGKKLLDEIIAQAEKSKDKQTVKQKKIIDTAIKMFAEKGYSNTSTAEIAKTAGVSEGSIFKNYGTKDKLLLSLIVPYLKEFASSMAEEALNEIMSEKLTSYKEFLRALLKNRINFICENREIFQIVIKEVIYNEQLKNELVPIISENIFSRAYKIIEYYKEQGELVEIATERIVKMMFTFIGGFFISNFVLLNKQFISDEEIEETVNFIIDGIGKI